MSIFNGGIGSGQIDMTRGSILRLLVSFSIPLIIGNLLQLTYNTVDSLVVGNYVGVAALGAVGTSGSPMSAVFCIFLGIGTGASILVSQFIGAGDRENVKKVVATAGSALLAVALPLTAAGVLIARPLLVLIRVQDDALPMAATYLSVIFCGSVASLGFQLNSGILRGLGDSRSPLLFMLVSAVVNVGLDLLFVAVFRWGVFGAALATVLSQTAAWVFSILFIQKRYPELDMRLFRISIDRRHLAGMVRLGLPIGLTSAVYSFGHLVLYSFINRNGTDFMAGFGAATKIDNLAWLPISSFAIAATTFAGQNMGSKNEPRLRLGIKTILRTAIATNVVCSGFMLLAGKWLLSFFTDDPEVIRAGYAYILSLDSAYFIYTVMFILIAYMNGAGDVRIPTAITLLMFWGVRLPAAWYLFGHFDRNLLFLCYPISWIAGTTMTVAYFLTGRWKRRLAE